MKSGAAAFAVFLSFLTYFVFGSGWYPESTLVIRGVAGEPGAEIVIAWNSGNGFNPYEREKFILDTVWPQGNPEHLLTIKRTGIKNGGSLNSDVRLYGIRLDGEREVPLKDLKSDTVILNDHGVLEFKKNGAAVQCSVQAKNHIRLEFPTNNYSGFVEIGVNGRTRKYDLYTSNSENRERGDEHTKEIDYWVIAPDGSFTITMPVPRYPIHTLSIQRTGGDTPIRFQSATIVTGNEKRALSLSDRCASGFVVNDLDSGRKRFWEPIRFAFQMGFAALSTWILFALWNMARKFSGPYDMFFNNGRYVFWSLFGGALVVFSLWLIAFWPGVMSVDSLKVWRAARIPGLFLNDHPVLNVIFYMYLMQIWDHIAVVPIIQITLASMLGAYILFSLYRKGIPLLALLPFYLFFVCSIPVGLYNIILWKDIPFALLVTFWAYTLGDMYYQKRKGKLIISWPKKAVLFLLYISLALIRHNGALYLLVIPLMLMVTGIISFKQIIICVLFLTVVGTAGFFIVNTRIKVADGDYFIEMASRFYKQIRQMPITDLVKRTASNYFFILNINQKKSKWDLWHYYLNDRYAYNFLKRVGWNDVYPYMKPGGYPSKWLHDNALKIYEYSYKSPWVYLTWNPVYMLGLFFFIIFIFRIFPVSAIFSAFIVVQIMALLLIFSLNWRYYYFSVFASYFLVPVMLLDIKSGKILGKVGIAG